MVPTTEIPIKCLRKSFESLKTQDLNQERKLLANILEEDLREPLIVIGSESDPIVIDGYKRLRCAEKLNWSDISCYFIEAEEAAGIIEFLNLARGKKTNMYDTSCFVRELLKKHEMNNSQIAMALGRSKSWVSLRTQFFVGMSDKTKVLVQKGKFPLHAWIYSVRPFTRINNIDVEQINTFVKIMSESNHSLREIDILAKVWFKGDQDKIKEIKEGHANWILERIEQRVHDQFLMSSFEQNFIKTLNSLKLSLMKALSIELPSSRSNDFDAQSDLLYAGILSIIEDVKTKLETLKC